MLNLNKITLLTIDGAGKNTNKVKNLFDICSTEVSFFDKKILTSDKNFKSYDDVSVVHIDPLDYKGYNKFCILELTNYVDSEFVLLVQNDGFISNLSKWTDAFLNYDYIGAPWHNEYGPNKFPWTNNGTKNLVGCGGFSLRSKKLLNLCASYDKNFVNDQILAGMHEDIFICVYAREQLENHGCVFSNLEYAKIFSEGIEQFKENITQNSFGFHGTKEHIQDAINNYNKKYTTKYTLADLY